LIDLVVELAAALRNVAGSPSTKSAIGRPPLALFVPLVIRPLKPNVAVRLERAVAVECGQRPDAAE
jgi:hypothetical protein